MKPKQTKRKPRTWWICIECQVMNDENSIIDCDCPKCTGHSLESCDGCGSQTVKVKEVLPRRRGK